MAETELPARDSTFEVDTTGSDDWVEILGIDTFTHKGGGKEADTTTYDDDGNPTHYVSSRTHEFTFKGKRLEDESDGSRDAGQEAVEAWAALKGTASVKPFRWTTPGGIVVSGDATAMMGSLAGGGNDDPNAWEFSAKISGALTNGSLPALPGAPSAADATAGNDRIEGTWSEGTGTGITMYEVQVFEDAGDTVVATLHVDRKPFLCGGLANATDYYFKVRARNAAGYGSWSAASDTVTTS